MLALALILAMAAPTIDPAVTPSKSLAAPRANAPVDDLCDEPVLMVVAQAANGNDLMRGPAAAATLARLGGYAMSGPAPTDVLGQPSPPQTVLRFPCRNNALAFWKTLPPATPAAIYPQTALPEALVGKVGDDSYSAAFGSAAPAKE